MAEYSVKRKIGQLKENFTTLKSLSNKIYSFHGQEMMCGCHRLLNCLEVLNA